MTGSHSRRRFLAVAAGVGTAGLAGCLGALRSLFGDNHAREDAEFTSADGGDAMLAPGDPVFGIEVDGEARAYPSTSSSVTRWSTTRSGTGVSRSPTVR